MIARRKLLIALATLGAAPCAIFAQPAGKIPRIGYLVFAPLAEPPTAERAAFLQGLRELGYVEGRNLEILYRSAEAEPDFLQGMAAELVQNKVDVIVAVGAIPRRWHTTPRARFPSS